MFETREIKNLQGAVYALLLNQPETRHNDFLLVMEIWMSQYDRLDDPSFCFIFFASRFTAGEFVSPVKIMEAKKDVIKMHPEFIRTGHV